MASSADAMGSAPSSGAVSPGTLPEDRLQRHAGVDRLFHWLTAAAVLTLMATALLPISGVKFDWTPVHWITGLILTVLVVFHLLRSLVWRKLRSIWFSKGELSGANVGKYSVAQKLMHHAMTLMVLSAVVTGLMMLKKIQTPLMIRDPYVFGFDTWGVIYVVHGLAALAAVTLVIIHVYFALIPENRMYLRAMVRGWITRQEQRARLAENAWLDKKTP
jgi:formate dehydrogenase subunit gamma